MKNVFNLLAVFMIAFLFLPIISNGTERNDVDVGFEIPTIESTIYINSTLEGVLLQDAKIDAETNQRQRATGIVIIGPMVMETINSNFKFTSWYLELLFVNVNTFSTNKDSSSIMVKQIKYSHLGRTKTKLFI